MGHKIVAGNWKMNLTLNEGLALVNDLLAHQTAIPSGVEMILCTPFIHMASVHGATQGAIALGAQDCSAHASGAYTGEVSASMVASTGAQYVIIGHSERRQYHHEDDATLLAKMQQALSQGLHVIFCVGEPESIREHGEQAAIDYVQKQLEVLCELPPEQHAALTVAYEPIWAIGTGKTASPQQASTMCLNISRFCTEHLNLPKEGIAVLYGGSCNAKNAKELFAQPGIAGGLIGGASLKADDFLAIANSF